MADNLAQSTEAYDEHFVLDNELMLNWYPRRVVEMAAGPSFLELGLGHGFSTELFARSFSPYSVIEGSPEMIERFRRRFAHVNLNVLPGFFETFATAQKFHNIGMGFVLEHVEDPEFLLRHYRQFLHPGGCIFVAVPNSECLHRRFGHAAGLLPDMQALSSADLAFGHRRYFTLRTLTELVEKSGYAVVKTEGLFLKPITTKQMVDLQLPPEILQAMLKVGCDYPELCNAILMKIQPRDAAHHG